MSKPQKLAHSFSATDMYEQCPEKYRQVRVLKLFQEDEHPSAVRGQEIHQHLEDCIADGEDSEEYQEVLDYVRSHPGLLIPEMELAIDANWTPCSWFDSERAWYRFKIDVTIINGTHATIIDYKTGKRRIKERQTVEYALGLFLHFPEIETVEFQLLWTELDNDPDVFQYERDRDKQMMLETILDIPEQIEYSQQHDDWQLNKTPLCSYCPVVSCRNWKKRPVFK